MIFYKLCFLQLETSMFSKFMFKPAPAVTGVPVPTQGVAHVPVVDVRVPGFCRANGTHLFYERKAIKVSFVYLSYEKIFLTKLEPLCMF